MMVDSNAGGSHTPMLASVLISRLGIFQMQRKNSTRGERLKTQSKSHDMRCISGVEERIMLQRRRM